MSLRSNVAGLMVKTEESIVALWAAHVAGDLDQAHFIPRAAAAIARANARATVLADYSLAAALMVQLRKPVRPVGLRIPADQDRLRDSVRTVLTDQVDYVTTPAEQASSIELRLRRLARAEPSRTAQRAMTEAMKQQPVEGWIRGLSANPCELCVSWADGEVRPPWVEMAQHATCACIQEPVAAS